jgi:peptidyl-tRNA hydrolase
MPYGNQLSQAMHAAIDYCMRFRPDDWHNTSNTIVVMQVKDEAELLLLQQRAEKKGVTYSMFREPAMENRATAMALDPDNEQSGKITSSLPLAMKPAKQTP